MLAFIEFFFYQNRFINEYARKKKAKISESRSHGVTESRNHGVFLVRYRRTYVLNNTIKLGNYKNCYFF